MTKNPSPSQITETIYLEPNGSTQPGILQRTKRILNSRLDRVVDWADEATVYQTLPVQGRLSWSQYLASRIGDVGFWLRHLPRFEAHQLKGNDWSVICVGPEKTKNEVSRILFPELPQEIKLPRIAMWQIPGAVQEWLQEAELVILEHGFWQPWWPETRYHFSIRPWLRQVLDITPPREEVMSRMHSERRRHWRKMDKMGYDFHFTRQMDDFELFYHQMYVPYITARHNNRATISPYDIHKLYLEADKGGLILIQYQGEAVAGVLCRASGEVCYVGSLGVREGHEALIDKELMLAIYWATVEWAWQQHLKVVDWNHSRAWQADGVFKFKRYWGTQVVTDLQTHAQWSFLANFPSAALVEQLNRLGFIREVNHQHYSILLLEEGEISSGLDLERQQRVAHHDGLADLWIVSPNYQGPLSQLISKRKGE